jgi:hypothetical protein
MSIRDLVTDPRTASAVSGGTVASGLGTWTDAIPNDIGKVATLIGAILSLIMIYVSLKKNAREAAEFEIKLHILTIERDKLIEKD